jgi:fatty-acyl-CoA synthase
MSAHPPIRSIRDIEALERVPLEERIESWDVYELIRRGSMLDPGKTALIYHEDAELDRPPVTLAHGALMGKFNQAANLFHRLGVGPGDAVCTLLPTVPQIFYAQMGGVASGVSCCVNWMLEPEKLAEIVAAAACKVLVALGPEDEVGIWRKVEAIRDALPAGCTVLSVAALGAERLPESDFDILMSRQPADRLVFERARGPDDIAAYVHSGGTTGTPKLAKIAHRGLAFKSWANAVLGGHEPDQTTFCDYPLFHIAGYFGKTMLPLIHGATILVPSAMGARSKRFLANYWKLVERYRVAYLSGVPTTLSVLVANPPKDGEDLSSFRPFATTGSAPLPAEVARQIEERFGVRMLATYGATEYTQNCTMVPRDGDPRYGSTGIRVPYVQVKTAMLDGKGGIARDCKVDEIGAIVVKGPSTIPGYVDPALDRTIFVSDGWVHSGDLGRIDADGYLWVTGRSKDLIIRGGHNIEPSMIEEALLAHDSVQLAAAVGKPDAHAGELPVAYVQLRPGAAADPAALRAFARARIPERAAAPVEVHVLERIPLSDVGKPLKTVLRDDAARRAFAAALAPLARKGVEVVVTVGPHPAHGTLATVTLSGTPADRPAVEGEAHRILDAYSTRHELVWRDK